MPLIQELDAKKHIPAPGYAYVPDTGPKLPNALVPTGRNRAARNHANASAYESTAKQDAKITRRLAELDKDNNRDVSIPVPIRHRDNAGRGKLTFRSLIFPSDLVESTSANNIIQRAMARSLQTCERY